MAKILTTTKSVVITDGGVAAVDTEVTYTKEVDEFARSSATIQTGKDITLCVQGTDIAGPPTITDPFVLPLSKITGYSIKSDVQLEVKENGAAVAVQAGPGEFGKDVAMIDTIELANESGLTGHVSFIVWGER
jgi:hypothetical protein